MSTRMPFKFIRKQIFAKPNRTSFYFVMWILFAGACHSKSTPDENSNLKGHLSTTLVNNPRSLHDDSSSLQQLGKLVFVDTIHDFKKIHEGEIVSYDFEFQNTGKKDILIAEAKASCGCTIASYPKDPIHSGQKNSIKVSFNSDGKHGYNDKLILVQTNGNPATYQLYIRAEVD